MKYNVNKKNCRLLTTKWSVGGYFLFPIVEVEHWSLFKKKNIYWSILYFTRNIMNSSQQLKREKSIINYLLNFNVNYMGYQLVNK